ncbi:SAM-dependent methyltransferase [Dyadobacter sediminis]|uniref:Methyltransferase domain-containing protein n=1 Tax=Dyadobacter sediminis TaxID=1493691 RepID=A0A5R9KBC5_9BACT|nr:SAM-dependent methyltransferase [Dyadobacter sediminis]TLU92065.1 methyltransferase domain-containing protein [Dyadobacter sediminis]GGB97725.1 methyltransferase [Dyadobacter sediminis]
MSDHKKSLTEDYFDKVYQNNEDPWNFETSEYEFNKYKTTMDALTCATYRNAFEIGCSIGVLSEMLAVRCQRLLSIDAAKAPLVKARRRLERFNHVQVQQMAVPGQFPDERFDLVLISEVGYYLSMTDLEILQGQILAHLDQYGQLLLVHWTPQVDDYPLTGDQVHEAFQLLSGPGQPLELLFSLREKTYRLDSFQKR